MKITKFRLASILTASAAVMLVGTSSADWVLETVDSDGKTGFSPSIALDDQNNPHIAYRIGVTGADPDVVKYACWTGTEWNIQTVDPDRSAIDVSMVFDDQEYPCIAFSSYNDLHYAHWTGTEWDVETIDIGCYGCTYVSLALDSTGNPHMAYYFGVGVSSWTLGYAYWSGSSWEVSTVDSLGDTGGMLSLALDANDCGHISYYNYDTDNLMYAHWTGTVWNTENVSTSGGCYTSIAVDSQNHPHISYRGIGNHLSYASWNSSYWDIQVVDPASYVYLGTSLFLDDFDNPRIAYADYTGYIHKLKYVFWNGSSWQSEIVDNNGEVGLYPSLALDTDGIPHIAYYDTDNKDLKFAYHVTTCIEDAETAPAPGSIILCPAYPNPGEESIIIRFILSDPSRTSLEIYDLTGRSVRTVTDGNLPAGEHEYVVSGLTSGTYLYQLVAEEHVATGKLVIR